MFEMDFSFVDIDSWMLLLVGIVVLIFLRYKQTNNSKNNVND